jgi:hypothetical protein
MKMRQTVQRILKRLKMSWHRMQGIQKYVGRVKEYGRVERRHSSFYIGLYGQTWVSFMGNCWELVMELIRLNPNKRKYYQ